MGENKLLVGWEKGLRGLCKEAKVTLIVPAEEAYGDRGLVEQGIPGGATLKYIIEVMNVGDPKPEPKNSFEIADFDKNGVLSLDEVKNYFKYHLEIEMPEDLFKKEDKNANGLIEWDEFSGPKGSSPPIITPTYPDITQKQDL